MSSSAYQSWIDIINRALQHCRMKRVTATSTSSANYQETAFAYDKCREAELRNNTWRFAIRRCILRAVDVSTLLWTPPAWAAGTTYPLGAVVTDAAGVWWQSKAASNVGNTPAQGASWAHYYGPDTCDPYVAAFTTDAPPTPPVLSTTAGGSLGARTEYVILTYVGADGETGPSSEVFQTVSSSHVTVVTSPAPETGMTGYNVYASDSTNTESLQNSVPINIGTNWTEPNTGLILGQGLPPGKIPTFSAGELTMIGGVVYLSMVSNNSDTPPTPNWLAVNGTTIPLQVLYPIGVGPARNLETANYFRLPHGFLRRAPQDPKAGINPYLGAARSHPLEDWLLENDYIVTSETGPLMLRYVGDVVDVPDMDAMFCEMLSARIAEEVAPILTDRKVLGAILAVVQGHYKAERTKAVAVNGIETGTEDPPEDDFITCRY